MYKGRIYCSIKLTCLYATAEMHFLENTKKIDHYKNYLQKVRTKTSLRTGNRKIANANI